MKSLWIEDYVAPRTYPKLEAKVEAEVCVIGGGITGIMAAYYLGRAGKKVILVEGGSLGFGESGYTTAFITYIVDARLNDLRHRFGDTKAALVWKSGEEAIDEIERIVREENIDCEFVRTPVKIFAAKKEDVKALKKEEELAKRYGFPLVTNEGSEQFPFGYATAPRQAKFHPRKFLLGVAHAAERYGVKIFENSPVITFTGKEGNTVGTEEGSVTAHEIVEATHSTIDHPVEVPSRLEANRSYVIETRIRSGLFTEGIYWDTEDPYHYFRVDPKGEYDRLILGGEDHKTGNKTDADSHYLNLETYLRALLRGEAYTVHRRWSGQILETSDGLPFIGRSLTNSHHLIATGYGGNGMTFGVIAAQTITSLIKGEEALFGDLYSPKRFGGVPSILGLAWRFFMNFVVARIMPRSDDIAGIPSGSGQIILRHGKKVAVSKDHDGNVRMVSAVCTHLGCVVNYNNVENTWDCPCHGSRFARDGKVINGPAKRPLPQIDP